MSEQIETAPETTVAETPVEAPAENTEKPKEEAVETKVETPPVLEKRKYKYKVDGEEKEAEYSDDDIVKVLSKAEGADKRFREAAETREKIMGLIESLKKDPVDALSSLGVDFRKAAEEYLTKVYKEEDLPPAEKMALEYQRKLEQLNAKEKALTEKEQSEIQARETEKYIAEYDKQISEALASSDLPKTRGTIRRIASYLERAITKGVDDITAADVLPLVREDYINEFKELYGNADEKTIMEILGKDKALKIAKAAATETVETPDNKANPAIQPKQSARKDKRLKWEEFEASLDKILQGK